MLLAGVLLIPLVVHIDDGRFVVFDVRSRLSWEIVCRRDGCTCGCENVKRRDIEVI